MKKLALQKRLQLTNLLSWVACLGLLAGALFVPGKAMGLILGVLAFAALLAQAMYLERVWRCPACGQALPHAGGLPPVHTVTECPACKHKLD